MRRLYVFLGILVVLFFYLGIRLSGGQNAFVWPLLIFVFGGVLAYPSRWLRLSTMSKAQHIFRMKVYMDMGLLCFLATFVILRDVLSLPLVFFWPQWLPAYFGPQSDALVIAISGATLAFGVWVARSDPKVKNIKIPIPDLPDSLVGYRIVQISDLHVGPTIGPGFVKRVVAKVNSLKPDLTVLTGDIVDGHVEHHLPTAKHLGALEPAGQVLFVTGNHEYYWDGPRWIREMEKLGLEVLQNSRRLITYNGEEILVAGVNDPAAVMVSTLDKPDLKKAIGTVRNSAVKILLAHQPDIAFDAAKAGFHLLLSGHTHAGQFFPFTLIIHKFQQFVKGLMPCGDMWVYVNQGTGYWGPPIRLGTVTEITLLELTKGDHARRTQQRNIHREHRLGGPGVLRPVDRASHF